MNIKDEALKLAIEAMDWELGGEPLPTLMVAARIACKEALEHQDQSARIKELEAELAEQQVFFTASMADTDYFRAEATVLNIRVDMLEDALAEQKEMCITFRKDASYLRARSTALEDGIRKALDD